MKCVRCNRPGYLTTTASGMMCQDCQYRLHIGDPGQPANTSTAGLPYLSGNKSLDDQARAREAYDRRSVVAVETDRHHWTCPACQGPSEGYYACNACVAAAKARLDR